MVESLSPPPCTIAALRRIAATPDRPVRESAAVDGWQAQGLARGRLHEVFAVEADDAPSGAGFAVAVAMAAAALPILWLRTERSERQGGRIHASGLAELGLAADLLVVGIVPDESALLQAAADAARCPGLGTLLVEAWGRAPGFDLTATRRLMLAAERSGVTVLTLRIGAHPTPSAAETRWGVTAVPSTALDADSPGRPAFDIELLRRRGGPAGQRWRVEWDRDAQAFNTPPLSRPCLPLVADRTVARLPLAFVRRAG